MTIFGSDAQEGDMAIRKDNKINSAAQKYLIKPYLS
jgi:hypothetical protein